MSGTVAVIAAHADDEVLGCGGSIARMVGYGNAVHVLLMADGETARVSAGAHASQVGSISARQSAAEVACEVLGCASLTQLSLPDNRMDTVGLLDVVKEIEKFLLRYKPSTVFTHHAGDVNVDHHIVSRAVVTACRPQPGHCVKELLSFEVPSSTEWQPPSVAQPFSPNWFVDISSTLDTKLKALQAYASELRPFPHPRSIEAITALARWRGATVGVHAAEAFVLMRKIL